VNDPRTHEASSGADASLNHLQHAIEHAAHLLPAQGPITVFIHHNTLHAFEHLPFTEAVKRGAKVFGCQPYLSEARYREELSKGRIRFDGLWSVLREELGERANEKVMGNVTRFDLRLAMLQYPLRFGPTDELLWFVAETDALRHMRPEVSAANRGLLIAETRRWAMRDLRLGNPAGSRKGAGMAELFARFGAASAEEWDDVAWEEFALNALWRVCRDGVTGLPAFTLPPAVPVRHRDLLLQATGEDADLLVHDLLIRFCGVFLDQGLAGWQLPRRDEGFYRAFVNLYAGERSRHEPWRRDLPKELSRLKAEGISPLASIRESLEVLGVRESDWEPFLSATLLALRGWAGMIHFLEERPDRAVHPVAPGSLVEFLAVRLLLDRLALASSARQSFGYTGPLKGLRGELRRLAGPIAPPTPEQRAFIVFQLAQVLGWTPEDLYKLDEPGWFELLEEIEVFSAVDRRRVLHLAYERRFLIRTLDALTLHARNRAAPPASRPRFQAIFCIDEREESIRRHLEELVPDAVSYGIPGFYFVPMYYRGADDAHYVPLCPAVMLPKHWVVETAEAGDEEAHERRTQTRRAWGRASHSIHVGSRTFAFGALLATAVGVLASIPLVARTLFPRLAARLRRAFGRFVSAGPRTRLKLERTEPAAGPEGGGIGFTFDELTSIAERIVRDIGLTSGFARLVFTFGHGSTSMNNPHESAHDCGACGGSRGGPNGRAAAQILNDPRIRRRLAERGLTIPPDTVFVGGLHNTSSAELIFYDVHRIPETHRDEFAAARKMLERACESDAHERCRRFESAPLDATFARARQHVEGRAEDLSQVRPEWGHATNAVAIVGRRWRTRGLFLDRRAFLNSYDPTQDDAEGTILTRILQAAVPVCAGINLEYYFSYVDSPGYGCGTKLPHNITSLLGVMDGAASDLRTGLPWQMVEIHEPVRLLFVVETTPELMLKIMEREAGIGGVIRNGWVYLALLDPNSPRIQMYRDGAFHPYQPQVSKLPTAPTSVDWYRGWREHLEFAEIG
jgi:uncharacterized protein YbcC (UPF0753/DUF2309 family)